MGENNGNRHIGRRLAIGSSKTYAIAAKKLGLLQREGRLSLKIRSGEHIAAVVICAQMHPEMPIISDTGGGLDLGFGDPLHTVVEVKSIGSKWREHEANLTIGDTFHAQVVTWVDAMEEIRKAAGRASKQLNEKVDGSLYSERPVRHVVVLAFLLDLLAIELFENDGLEAELPQLGDVSVDFVWFVLSLEPYKSGNANIKVGPYISARTGTATVSPSPSTGTNLKKSFLRQPT